VPVAYVAPSSDWSVPIAPVTSLFSPATQPLFFLPVTQSPCSVWLRGFSNVVPGAWLLCPLGGVQALLTGRVEAFLLVPTIVAILIFIVLIVLLGNVFCSWFCPIGTMVDSFDKGVEKFLPKVEAKRSKRSLQSVQSTRDKHGSPLLCPLCPISKVIPNRNGVLANGILASALVGSVALRFNVFCTVCPVGISARGLMHLKATTYITKVINPILVELWVLPVAAVLVSIRERRFWCKKLCPLGGFLNGLGALNPFIKPKVRQEKCIMKGCSDECEDYHIDYCGICRLEDERRCEKVCPVGINLVDNGSLHKCTKCMECYIACDYNAVGVDLLGKPEVFRMSGFFRRLRARWHKDKEVKPIENRRDANDVERLTRAMPRSKR